MKSSEDDFELMYDSDSVKSTESIHEARKKIENPRKIISLLNNLSALDLNDPAVKAEFLKNVIDFEEKYGKLDDEGSPLTKRSKESNLNTDRNPPSDKNAENNEIQANNQNLALNTNTLEEKAKQIEKEINENTGKLDIGLAEKLEELKKNYDELIKSDRIALETLSKEQNADALNLNQPLFITANENQDKDLMFLTSPSLNKITEKDSGSKQQTLRTEENTSKKENEPTSKSEKELNLKKTEKNNDGIKEFTQENSKKEIKLDEQPSNRYKENSLIKEKDLEKKATKNQSVHSKASNNSQTSKQKRGPQASKQDRKEKPSSIHFSSNKEKSKTINNKGEKINNILNNNEIIENSQKNSTIHETNKSPSKYKNKEEIQRQTNKKDSDSSDVEDSLEAGDLDELLSPKNKQTSEKKGKKPLLKGLSLSKNKKLHRKMPTLDLASVSNKENTSQFKSSQSQNQILSEHENMSEFNDSSQILGNEEDQSLEEYEDLSANNLENNLENLINSEENRISFPTSQQNREFVSSSRKEFQFSERSEYEMINNEILDEDLEILIKTSENNNKINSEFGESDEGNKKLREAREKVIKKLEKQFGKAHAKKKLQIIEKQILRESKKPKVDFLK